MSARAEHTPEAAARSLEQYVDTNDIKGDSASSALLESANESIGKYLNSDNMPSAKLTSELEERGVLPKVALDQFDKIAAVDGEDGEISQEDLDTITSDKSGRFDAVTRLAADYFSRNRTQIAESDNGITNLNVWDMFAADQTIDRGEMETFVEDKDAKFKATDVSYRQHQGRDVENMAVDIGNFLDRPDDERDVDILKLDRELQEGGFTEPGSENVLGLMKAMERNGTAGDFIAQQLNSDVDDYFGENADVTKEDLRKIASSDRSHSRRLAAQLALRNFDAIDSSDNGYTSWLSDSDSLNQSELQTFAKQNVGESGNVIRQYKQTREASDAYHEHAQTEGDENTTAHEKKVAKVQADSEIRETGLLDQDLNSEQRGQRKALLASMEPEDVATVALSGNNFKKISGEDSLITRDEAARAADNKNLDATSRLTARALHQNFDDIANRDYSPGTISSADLRILKRQGERNPNLRFSDATGSASDSGGDSVSEKSSEQELKELVLDEGASGEGRVRALLELHDRGVNTIKMKVGDRTETAKIHYSKGADGMPDSIYLFDGKGNPMLRAHVERGDEGEFSITKQRSGPGVEASFEGINWTDRVRKTEGREATLDEPEIKEKQKIESKAKVLEDEDSSIQQKLEAIFETKNDWDKVSIRTEDGQVIEGTIRKNEAGWVGIAGPDGRFFVKGQMRGGEIVPDNPQGHWANKSKLHNYRELVMHGWAIE